MAAINEFGSKIAAVCTHNRGGALHAPTRKTEILDWLDLSAGYLSRYYKESKPNVPLFIERAVVMALGFGPADETFEKGWNEAWTSWLADWRAVWREGSPDQLVKRLETTNFFVPRRNSDRYLQKAMSLIPRRKRDSTHKLTYGAVLTQRTGDDPDKSSSRRERYLDRLASLRATCVATGTSKELTVDMSFGMVDVPAGEVTYKVELNRCRVEILFDEASFFPTLHEDTIEGSTPLSAPVRMSRETSRVNHPSWIIENPAPKTPLRGEYRHLSLGRVVGVILPADEAQFLVLRSQFAISDEQENPLPLGIVNNIIKYLITEHIGEIRERGSRYYLATTNVAVTSDGS